MEDQDPGMMQDTKKRVGRPHSLVILCAMSFIGSGLSTISSFFVAGAFELMPAAIKTSMLPESEELLKLIQTAGPLFFVIMGILYLVSFIGVYLMFKLRKTGFHFYTSSQLVMLMVPTFMINGFTLPVSNLMLTGSFILAYAVNLKNMH